MVGLLLGALRSKAVRTCLWNRLTGGPDASAFNAWLNQAEFEGHIGRQARQLTSDASPVEAWYVTEAGETYLRGRAVD